MNFRERQQNREFFMGQKDLSEKLLVAFDDVFADIVNVLLFGGRCVIRPEELEDKGSGSVYKDGDMLREMDRDVVKRWRKGENFTGKSGSSGRTGSLRE